MLPLFMTSSSPWRLAVIWKHVRIKIACSDKITPRLRGFPHEPEPLIIFDLNAIYKWGTHNYNNSDITWVNEWIFLLHHITSSYAHRHTINSIHAARRAAGHTWRSAQSSYSDIRYYTHVLLLLQPLLWQHCWWVLVRVMFAALLERLVCKINFHRVEKFI